MAVGRPVIVAAREEAPALAESIRCGRAAPPEDGPALAQALQRLVRDPEAARAMGLAERARASESRRSRQLERLERLLAQAARAGDG